MSTILHHIKIILLTTCVSLTTAAGVLAAPLTWSTVKATASGTTNQLRAVALADDDESVYIGYIQTTGGNRRVYQHDTASPYSLLNTHVSGNDQPKGIVADDRGNVFVSNRGSGSTSSFIQSFTSTLSPISSTSFTTPVIGGIAIQKAGATYYAYTVYETGGLIQRYDVTNPAAMTLDATFGTGGSYNIPGGNNLRGIEVGADGSLYIAARDDHRVYKVSSDLTTVTSHTLNRAMDVALYGGNIYATSYAGAGSFIRVIDPATMAFVEDITIATLDGNPYSRGTSEGWSGIDIDGSGNIWLADQAYGSTGGTQDRLLLGSSLAIPEPSTFALVAMACFGVVGLRRKQR
jgi:hypothetical protein